MVVTETLLIQFYEALFLVSIRWEIPFSYSFAENTRESPSSILWRVLAGEPPFMS